MIPFQSTGCNKLWSVNVSNDNKINKPAITLPIFKTITFLLSSATDCKTYTKSKKNFEHKFKKLVLSVYSLHVTFDTFLSSIQKTLDKTILPQNLQRAFIQTTSLYQIDLIRNMLNENICFLCHSDKLQAFYITYSGILW